MDDDGDCLPKIGKKYRRWGLKLDKSIGEKSVFGSVYIVCDEEDDCSYAMKVIKPVRGQTKEETEKSFKKEVKMQNKCATPGYDHCLKVEDSWSCKNGEINVIITRLLKETIYRHLAKADVFEKVRTLRSLISRIFFLHFDTLIYHHDTHLNNFMIDNKGSIKMIDLGLAQEIGFDSEGNLSTIRDMYLHQILADYMILSNSLEKSFPGFPFFDSFIKMQDKLLISFKNIEEIFGKYQININLYKETKIAPIENPKYCATQESYMNFVKEKRDFAKKHGYIDLNSLQFLLLGVEKRIVSQYISDIIKIEV